MRMHGIFGVVAVAALGLVATNPASATDRDPDAPRSAHSAPAPTLSSRSPGAGYYAVPPVSTKADHVMRTKIHGLRMGIILRKGAPDGAATTENDGNSTRTILAGDVNFEVDSAVLTERAKQILDDVAVQWKKKPPRGEVAIVGHTDSVADDSHNQTLSEQRATAVKDYLGGKSSGVTVTAAGKGETSPVAEETNPDGSVNEAGRAANRRVEIRWKN